MSEEWYCVRCIFDLGASRKVEGARTYEERLVLVRAESFDDAIRKAEVEAQEYAGQGITYKGFSQTYHLFEELVEDGFHNGTEVFSLLRDSELSSDEYIDEFFDTGYEYPGPTTPVDG